ncbi:MAG TPA: hypothetical protein PKA88_34940, partial [Polyangiaceae bacterium]|nr:hypothetical protein [Polyangiaceae bacterium]
MNAAHDGVSEAAHRLAQTDDDGIGNDRVANVELFDDIDPGDGDQVVPREPMASGDPESEIMRATRPAARSHQLRVGLRARR